jgi:hypothetical protein
MLEENLIKFIAVRIAVYLLVADDLSHLGFFLGIELIDFTTTVGLHLFG